MRLNILDINSLLLLALTLLLACHDDDDKPQPEHEGQGRLRITVANANRQALTLRIYGEALTEPLESHFEASEAAPLFEAWLPVGTYRALVFSGDTEEVTVGAQNAATLPPLDTPVYAAIHSDIALAERKDTELTLEPKDVRKMVRLAVTAPEGLISGPIEATLSGIASGLDLATGQTSSPATLAFTLPTPDAQQTTRATAGTLGIVWPLENASEPAAIDHVLTLTWQSDDGKELTYSEDVAEALFRADQSGADTLDLAVVASTRVPIRLYTGILTRATVDAFDQTPVCIASGTAPGTYTESWDGLADPNEITLQPERYYPTDGSALYLRGYYPPAPLENGSVHYTLTGQEDLMLSVEQSGSLADRFDAKESPLTYRHLLSQLNFKIQLTGAKENYLIRSVKLNGLAAQARVDLMTETVVPIGQSAPIIIYTDPGTGGFPITNGTVLLPGYVLVQPEAQLTLDLVLNIDGNPANDLHFTNVPVTFTGGSTEGGSAYEVEIFLKVDPDPTPEPTPDPTPDPGPGPGPTPPPTPPEPDATDGIKVTITAKVIDWDKGENGGVVV